MGAAHRIHTFQDRPITHNMLINNHLQPVNLNSCSHQQQTKRTKCINIIIIAAIILISSISIGIRAYHTTPTGDDIIYAYVLGPETQGNAPVIGPIESVGDAIFSQSNQYLHHNGRFFVHVILQTICGLSPQTGYSILAGLLISSTLILIILLTIPKQQRQNPIYWLVGALLLLYVFPSNSTIWLSRALCFNYLLPMSLVLAYLVLYRH